MDTTDSVPRRGGRVREWFGRYAPAEVGAIVMALLATGFAAPFGVAVATAYAGAIGEGVGFYTVMFVRDLGRQAPGPRGVAVATTLRGLLLEFGPAELLDGLVVRPLAIYLAGQLIGNPTAGFLIGKIAADAIFYSVAILAYELRKHVTGRRHVQARGTARVHSRPVTTWTDPSLRREDAATEAIDLLSVPTTRLTLR